MSACDCLECKFRRTDREAVHTREDLRLRAAMTALSRVMYWVWVELRAEESARCGSDLCDFDGIECGLDSGYFRLVYA